MKYFAVLLGLMATLVTHAAAQGLLPDTWPSLAQRQPCEARRQSSSNPDRSCLLVFQRFGTTYNFQNFLGNCCLAGFVIGKV